MLKERPYLSCKVLCRHFRIATGACLRILHDWLGMTKDHLRWVSTVMDTNQKAERVSLPHGILSVLQSVRFTGFQRVISGDESCFFLYYLCGSIWASSRDKVPERFSQRNNTEKCLISLLWSVNGIHSLVNVLKASTYSSAFFCDTVVPSLFDEITSHSRRQSLKVYTST
jgi:hypothetical protein